MKKFLLVILLAFAGSILNSEGVITGSAHDFSSSGWSSNSICAPCHTPHGSTAGAGPLWNHTTTTNSYVLYTSSTMSHVPGQPDAKSKACLSCHDGSVALDAYAGGAGGTANISDYPAGRTIGGGNSLADDHPIGINYDTSQGAGDALFDETAKVFPGDTSGRVVDDYLEAKVMGCYTCHDVHNTDGHTSLLRGNNNSSSLCLTCHNK